MLRSSDLPCCALLRCALWYCVLAALSVALPVWLAGCPSGRSVLRCWFVWQCSLCVRCLAALPSNAPAQSASASAPVGGATFAEFDFLRVYACLLLTTALSEVAAEDGHWKLQQPTREAEQAKAAGQ